IARNAAGAEVDRATGTAAVTTGAIAEASLQLPGGKPDLLVPEAAHEFGAQLEGVPGIAVNVNFHNAGFRPSGNISAALGGVGASSWSIGTDGCSNAALAAGADCAIGLIFKPVAMGTLAATLTITASPGGSAVVALTGTGSANPKTLTV